MRVVFPRCYSQKVRKYLSDFIPWGSRNHQFDWAAPLPNIALSYILFNRISSFCHIFYWTELVSCANPAQFKFLNKELLLIPPYIVRYLQKSSNRKNQKTYAQKRLSLFTVREKGRENDTLRISWLHIYEFVLCLCMCCGVARSMLWIILQCFFMKNP